MSESEPMNHVRDSWEKAEILSKVFSSCFLGFLAVLVPLLLWKADQQSRRLDIATKVIPLLVTNPEDANGVQRQKLTIAYLDKNSAGEYRVLIELATQPTTQAVAISAILQQIEVLGKAKKLPASGVLRKTSDMDLQALRYATPYSIRIELGKDLPASVIRESNRFLAWESGNLNAIVKVAPTWLGFSNERGEYSHVSLWGDFSPEKNYTVGIFYPEGNVSLLEVPRNTWN